MFENLGKFSVYDLFTEKVCSLNVLQFWDWSLERN